MVFSFATDYILENTFARLVPLQLDHFQDLLPFSLNEPGLWDYSLGTAAGPENLKKYIGKAVSSRNNHEAYPFVVFDKRTEEYAGVTRYYDINLTHNYLSIGHTWYGESFQGTGLNKACKYLLFEFAFEKMNIERIEFRADARNLRSIAAIKSLGCTQEGILRSNGNAADGSRRDSVVLSLLKTEWQHQIKQELSTKLSWIV